MSEDPVRLLLVTGSTRTGSTCTAALRTAGAGAPAGVTAVLWQGLVGLPAFVPDDAGADPAVTGLREQVGAADAVLFCSPEYAGTLPGSLKNAIDWLIGSGELYRKPVAWINVSGPGRGAGAQATLASVLGYVDAEVIGAACVHVPVPRSSIGADGTVQDEGIRARLRAALDTVTDHLRPAGGT